MSNHPNRSVKTVRLPADSYRIAGGNIEALYAESTGYQPDYEARNFTAELAKCESWDWHATRYEVGTQVVLVSSTDVSPNALRAGTRPEYWLSFDLEGVPGNLNPRIKSTSGWRGTTNDRSVDAHGVVTIRKIRILRNGDIAITVR